MSRPRHLIKEEHVLKVKAWVAILIAVAISAEIGVALAIVAKIYGK